MDKKQLLVFEVKILEKMCELMETHLFIFLAFIVL